MIYCIDDNILYKLQRKTDIKSIEKLMTLLHSIMLSKYNYVSTNVSEFLESCQKALCSIDTKEQPNTFKVLKSIESDFFETQSLISEIHPKAIMHIDDEPSIKTSGNDILINYSGNKDIQININEPACLASENMSDNKLYEIMAKMFFNKKIAKSQKEFSLNIKFQNGGGRTITEVLKSIIFHDKQFVLGIVDSDKKAPDDSLGCTAMNASSEKVLGERQDLTGVYELLILSVHEKENLLLPSDYLKSKLNMAPSMVENLKKLEKIECSVDAQKKYYWDYYDLKKGINEKNKPFFLNLLKEDPELKSRSESENISIRLCRNPTKYVDLSKVNWTNKNNHLYKERKEIASFVIAFGFSKKVSRIL